jgi:hypothetical protein
MHLRMDVVNPGLETMALIKLVNRTAREAGEDSRRETEHSRREGRCAGRNWGGSFTNGEDRRGSAKSGGIIVHQAARRGTKGGNSSPPRRHR